MNSLDEWDENSAYEYYKQVYNAGLFTEEQLQNKYDDAESHRKEWENYGDNPYKLRDYKSFCNAQNALSKLLTEIKGGNELCQQQ